MQWRAAGFVLAARAHGEHSAIVEVFTQAHGRVAGLVRGAKGQRMRALMQPGVGVSAQWRARLSEHLGQYTLEPNTDIGLRGFDFSHHASLLGVQVLCQLLRELPERAPHARLFDASALVLQCLTKPDIWPGQLVRTELLLLDDMGFGLDLSRCVVTGTGTDLRYVSPRSGCAVSAQGAGAYAPRLLPLPDFLLADWQRPQCVGRDALAKGFAITTHFLTQRLFAPAGRALPPIHADMVRLLLA